MILYRWQGSARNFGDELNTVIWPRLLPDFFDENPDIRFLGIGSILDARHPARLMKVVAGSGYGGYERKATIDRNWVFHWVRGPATAAAIGLPSGAALVDPALLLPLACYCPALPRCQIGFMPHFETAARGVWHRAAAMAGITLIDPRDPPAVVLDAIRRCKVLLSEALHGIIVADTLRVPWIAMRPLAGIHRAKWRDWSGQMELSLRPHPLPASTVAEWVEVRGFTAIHKVRTWLNSQGRRLDGITSEERVERAAQALRRAASAEPQLSASTVLDQCQDRMMEALVSLRRQPTPSARDRGQTASRSIRLPHVDDSVYELKPVG